MPMLRIQDVAERLSVSVPRTYELVRLGLIPATRVGRQIRVDPQALERWIEQGGRRLPGGWRREPSLAHIT